MKRREVEKEKERGGLPGGRGNGRWNTIWILLEPGQNLSINILSLSPPICLSIYFFLFFSFFFRSVIFLFSFPFLFFSSLLFSLSLSLSLSLSFPFFSSSFHFFFFFIHRWVIAAFDSGVIGPISAAMEMTHILVEPVDATRYTRPGRPDSVVACKMRNRRIWNTSPMGRRTAFCSFPTSTLPGPLPLFSAGSGVKGRTGRGKRESGRESRSTGRLRAVTRGLSFRNDPQADRRSVQQASVADRCANGRWFALAWPRKRAHALRHQRCNGSVGGLLGKCVIKGSKREILLGGICSVRPLELSSTCFFYRWKFVVCLICWTDFSEFLIHRNWHIAYETLWQTRWSSP